eukprot:PITA_36122
MDINYSNINAGSDESSIRAARWKYPTRILAIALASTLLIVSVTGLSEGVSNGFSKERNGGGAQIMHWKSTSNAVHRACSSTLYPEFCVSSVSSFPGLSKRPNPMEIVKAVVHLSIYAVEKVTAKAHSLSCPGLDQRQRGALKDCFELFHDTLDELHGTLSDLKNATFMSIPQYASDLETLLSAAITNQYTCLDSFSHSKGNLKQRLLGGLRNVSRLVSNSLAMVKNISAEASSLANQRRTFPTQNRRLLSDQSDPNFMPMDSDGFPTWMSAGNRRLLQTSTSTVKPNVVVAKDGSGNYTNITEAVEKAPEKSQTRYVIHIKAGVYAENVELHKKKTNIMFVGDGMDVTVVTGNRNVKDNFTTFRSATVAVTGNGFIARDMTFENTAGPAKHQAVALRVGSDLSAFYRCSFKGYQDTLYAHSFRQFYRECNIYGTVDFIFGNSAVVFQDCNLLARRPLENQKILYTAQGRQDPNENTGISIQNCNVTAAPDLAPVKSSFEAYLGRPWKEYSRTVFMQSFLGDLIQPAGWLEWNGSFALSTLYYGEYMNRGPGAGTTNRVKWPGYRVINSSSEASSFTVSKFIEGDSWLPSTGVKYVSGFTSTTTGT